MKIAVSPVVKVAFSLVGSWGNVWAFALMVTLGTGFSMGNRNYSHIVKKMIAFLLSKKS